MASWGEPVPVAVGRARATTLGVSSPERAAEVLLDDWPAGAAPARHLAARKAVLRALERAADARAATAARKAFIAAADEAGILRESTRPVPVASDGPKLWKARKRKLKREM